MPNDRRYIENELIAGIKSKTEIASDLGCSRQTIYNTINYYLTPIDGSPSSLLNKPRQGYRKLSAQEIYGLEQFVDDHPFHTNQQIVDELELSISSRSVGNYLKELGIGTFVAAKKPLINLTNLALRSSWADEHIAWEADLWRRCAFTDESTFQNYAEGRQLVKRRSGTRYDSRYIVNFEAQSNIKRNFYGVMLYNKPVKLFEASDNLNEIEFSQLFFQEVLPYLQSEGVENLVIQMDRATVHGDAKRRLEEKGFTLLPWCPKMFDISPIENIWGIGKRKKNHLLMNKTFSNQFNFDVAIKELIENIPIYVINKLYDTMPHRVKLLKENEGRQIKY